MGEISDLVGIYGAIDDAVAANPELRARVARVIPAYRDPDLRWFSDFDDWTRERTESEGSPFPTVREALKGLAANVPEGRMRARRLHAIAGALRAIPELASDANRGFVRGALRAESIADTEGEAEGDADRLVELLGSDDPVAAERVTAGDQLAGTRAARDDPDAWWRSLRGAIGGIVRDPEGIGHRPCTGRVVNVPLPGGKGHAAALSTEWETELVAFDDACRFLRPVNWPGCSAFWCTMDELKVLPSHVHQYREVVSTDCSRKASAWTIEAALDFRFTNLDDLAITDYKLSDGHPKDGDDVQVDEGSLVVRRIGPGRLRITTTKRIEFTRYFSPGALAMIMCVLGYAHVVEDLVFSCARTGKGKTGKGKKGPGGTGFPGRRPTRRKGAPHPPPPPLSEIVAEEVATVAKECIDDCVEVVQVSSRKMAEGRYTADDLVRDVTHVWARGLRDGAKALDLGGLNTRVTARARARDP